MGRKLKLYLKMVEDHIESHEALCARMLRLRLAKEAKKPPNDDRKLRKRVGHRVWCAQWRLEHPQKAKEKHRKDWYVRSCRNAGVEPLTPL